MRTLTKVVVGFVALEHLGFLVLEALLWTSPFGRDTFHTTPEFAEASKALAANQGLYNGFLAGALALSLWAKHDLVARTIALYTLLCVVVAGIFGAVTADPSIFVVQGLPALIGFILVARDRSAAA